MSNCGAILRSITSELRSRLVDFCCERAVAVADRLGAELVFLDAILDSSVLSPLGCTYSLSVGFSVEIFLKSSPR